MGDALLVLARDVSSSLAVLLGTPTLTTLLLLVGAAGLVAMALTFVARVTTVGPRLLPVTAPVLRRDDELPPLVTQSDPHAPGRPRPRAPGRLGG
ncbi:DUF6412 domain-containing protein [Isoptericola variabilis]|uniref:DUF6412 domain-containing protein n=1 Tax=Isoptericola variabilis TaxID=139208 RepID=UPI002B66BA28|nr:DUF6412 domain-containing protein [Isoptericola sp.]